MIEPAKAVPEKCAAMLEKARALLVLDHPFFASVALKKPVMWTKSVPTAAVDARGKIYINPEFAAPLTVQQLLFLLAHECMHYMLQHGPRRGARDREAWNIAADKVINETLVAANVGHFIDGGQRHPGAETMNAEALYVEPPAGGSGGAGGVGGPGNDLLDEQLTDGEARELSAQAQIDMVQAKQIAQMQGKLPAGIARLVDALIDVPTPWHKILERFMESFRKDDISWARPNRRYIHSGVYLPGQSYIPEMGTVVVGVDTSGSISDAELAHFAGHINRIIEQCRPEAVYVVYCDAEVNKVARYTCDDLPIKLEACGGGGTDLRKIFDWVGANGIDPDVAVVLTDMYTPFPSSSPSYATVWLSTSGGTRAPFGSVVPYQMDA